MKIQEQEINDPEACSQCQQVAFSKEKKLRTAQEELSTGKVMPRSDALDSLASLQQIKGKGVTFSTLRIREVTGALWACFLTYINERVEKTCKVPASSSKSVIFNYPQLCIIMNSEDISCLLQSSPNSSRPSTWRFRNPTYSFTSSEPLLVLPSSRSAGKSFPFSFKPHHHLLKTQLKVVFFETHPSPCPRRPTLSFFGVPQQITLLCITLFLWDLNLLVPQFHHL